MKKRFKIQFADARTGILLGPNGRYHISGDPLPQAHCPTADQASELYGTFFREHPWAECLLTDTVTGDQQTISNPDSHALERYNAWHAEKIEFNKWRAIPKLIRFLVKQPKLIMFDPERPDHWPTDAS